MGTNPNKYHISDDGKVYRINEDGSFTSLGNIEDRTEHKRPQSNFFQQIESAPKNHRSVAAFFKTLLSVTGLTLFVGAMVMKFDGYLYIQCLGCAIYLLNFAIKTEN